MLWTRLVILVVALAMLGCSKKADETPAAEEEWPKHGLTEAQANEVLAKVGDQTITVGEFADRLASQSPYIRARFESPKRRKEFLDNMVRFELLAYEARRRGYADDPEIIRTRRNAMIQQLIKNEVDTPLEGSGITDEEVQAVYDANPTAFDRPAQMRASHILIKDRARARSILAEAKKADLSTFRKLAREHSEDEATKKNAGDLHFFTADAEPPPPSALRDAAFTLERVGAVYPTLVEDADGYHIVMLTGKRAALKRTYEQAKRAIRHKLANERKDAAMEALTERLREEVEVEIDYEALKDVKVDLPNMPKAP